MYLKTKQQAFWKASLFLCFLLGLTGKVWAQKPPLNHEVYDSWQNFGKREISDNGKWLIYNVNVQEGDANLYLQESFKKAPKQKFNRATNARILEGDQHLVFSIKPFYTDIKANRVNKSKKAKDKKELAKDSLGIYNLKSHKLEKIDNVLSYKTAKKNGNYIAYVQELTKENTDTTSKKKEEKYKELVLRDLSTGKEFRHENPEQYLFSEDGNFLAFSLKQEKEKKADKKKEDEESEESEESEDETTEASEEEAKAQGLYIVDTKNFQVHKVLEETGTYSKLSFNEDSNLLSFIATHDKTDEEIKSYLIYLYDINTKQVKKFENSIQGMPEDYVISDNFSPVFSNNGAKLYLGIAPKKEPKDTTFIQEDHAILDIWHYKDDYLQTQQLASLKRDLNKTYLSVIDLSQTQKLVRLEEENMNLVRTVDKGDADFVLGISDYGNRVSKQWHVSGVNSYYTIDLKTGKKKEILKDLHGNLNISPKGKNVVFFDRNTANWYSMDLATEKIIHLNKGLDVSFADEKHDSPDTANSYRILGWNEDESKVFIHDRFDIWAFNTTGEANPQNVTSGYGRANTINFNYIKLDSELDHIPSDKWTLAAFNETNKESGYYTLELGKKPVKVLMEPMSGHRSLVKAKDANVYYYTQESFAIPPTLVSTKNLKTKHILHETNPQQKNYNWGTVELIHYTSGNGKPATGMLFKPEDFDASKKYPMISYFYEQRSDNLHSYEAPAPTPSRLNITYFVSNGYIIFVPDIIYTEGHPGRSAEEYIDAGVDHLIATYDFINPDKIGIQGQSWGGYQVAHLITRSDRYAAAWSGAPVVNMTSAYGGIRWTTGMNRQFQYEKTQSRIGKDLWEGFDLYIENSPLFYMKNVTTPVVIMHNDEDGAVPWYQGIEMYTALRRLEKPVWLLNYNGDEHNLIKRQNRKDIQIREQQFFDHYLKDAKAPEWMVHGIPAVKKGKTWGFDLTDEKP